MKRILALLLALVMLLTLTACGKDEESTPTGESTGTTNHTTESTNDPTDGTQSTTEGDSEGTESTEGTTSTDSTISTSKPTEAPSTENCDHSYKTDGMTNCMGILTYICSKCQHSYEVETGKVDHKWKNSYTKQPTLTEEGVLCQECIECHLKQTQSAGKLLPSYNVYIDILHCFLESDSPLNTELYTWQGKAKAILYARYPNEITEAELFTARRCWQYDISNDEIQKIKTTSHYNSAKKVFLSYDDGPHSPVFTSYLGYTGNGDGTVTAYTTVAVRTNGQYVESGYCKVQMKYGAPPTNEDRGTFHITFIMRVESIPASLTK